MIEFKHISPSELPALTVPQYTSFELNYKKLKECQIAKITAIEELRKHSDEVKSTLRITIQLPDTVTYDLAQNIVIYPSNSQEKVGKALEYLGIAKDDLVLIGADQKAKLPFDNLLTLEEILYRYVDLNAAPKFGN